MKKMVSVRESFTVIEILMVVVIIGILAMLAIPRFINMRKTAENARAEANIGALRSAILIYYAKTALSKYACLCVSQPDGGCNPYRTETVPAPCYPANYEELEVQLVSPPVWGEGGGACYDSTTGEVVACP